MPKIIPRKLIVNAQFAADSLASASRLVSPILEEIGLAAKARFKLESGPSATTLVGLPSTFADEDYVSGKWPDGGILELAVNPGRKPTLINLLLSLPVEPARFKDVSKQATAFVQTICKQYQVASANVVRYGGISFTFLPDTNVCWSSQQLLFADEASVAEEYDDPAAFWNAPFDFREPCGHGHLLGRSLLIADDLAYLKHAAPMQWTLARAAKAGRTVYPGPTVPEEAEEIYREGESVLHPVAHIAEDNLAEFSCYLGEGQHIPGWEIFNLKNLKEEGQLPDGRRTDVVRVVFYSREMALGERRPLLDNAIQVFFQDGARGITEITA